MTFEDNFAEYTPVFNDVTVGKETEKANVSRIVLDYSRDALLTAFSVATLKDRYMLPGEDPQKLFARVACFGADNQEHAQRLYDYMSKLWFMPATPILSNGGAGKGALPISCYCNETEDNLHDIVNVWNENVWLGSKGGGIGTYWGNLRSIGEKIGKVGKTSGIIPFIRVMDSITLGISQGSQRRGAAAVYLDVSHPEIDEFLEIRRPTGGDPNRKAAYLHHGILIPDAFMEAVKENAPWNLTSPKTHEVIRTVKARDLWMRILLARIETGEPYLIFSDAVARGQPEAHKKNRLSIRTSNLCSEILLPTGRDHHNKQRTAVCCLSSVNLETWKEWSEDKQFIEDCMRFLDNVLQSFIDDAPPEFYKATYSAMRERSVGLGVMGFHGFLQKNNVPFESVIAKVWNKRIFKHIKQQADKASITLAHERGACPDAKEHGIMERFMHKLAIAPTASISIIAGNASPGIEPWLGNVFTQKTLDGSFLVCNKALEVVLASYDKNTEETWQSITMRNGQRAAFRFSVRTRKVGV